MRDEREWEKLRELENKPNSIFIRAKLENSGKVVLKEKGFRGNEVNRPSAHGKTPVKLTVSNIPPKKFIYVYYICFPT